MTFITYLTRRTKQLTMDTTTKKTSYHQSLNNNNKQQQRNKKEIGDYWLGKTIGRGASGRVKLGIHKITGEKVAIKMIARSQLMSSNTTTKSVQRELAVLQLLHHPHLVELKQVLQDSSYVYFILEYMEGGELFHILAEKGKFKESDARSLFSQMVSALAWCHSHHICHRDLKPENILLDKSKKNIKIADFGMAAMNTCLKTSCGSPHYASPEIVKGQSYDGVTTDVWSLGVILYALVCGHLPFDDESISRLLGKIKTGKYRSLPKSLSFEVKDLIKKMLIVDTTKRITMNEILNHPWLSKYFDEPYYSTDPLQQSFLISPMISHYLDLDGRIWETLKVLWRDLRQEEIIQALTSKGSNLQKLTCHLLQQRTKRLEQDEWKKMDHEKENLLPTARRTHSLDDGTNNQQQYYYNKVMHKRHGSDEAGSKCSIATPYDSTISTVSCTRTIDMPDTPKNDTFDLGLHMDESRRKYWDKCDHLAGIENGDPCFNCPSIQGSHAYCTSPLSSTITTTTANTILSPQQSNQKLKWFYHGHQLTLSDILETIPSSHSLINNNNNTSTSPPQLLNKIVTKSQSNHMNDNNNNNNNNQYITNINVEGKMNHHINKNNNDLNHHDFKKNRFDDDNHYHHSLIDQLHQHQQKQQQNVSSYTFKLQSLWKNLSSSSPSSSSSSLNSITADSLSYWFTKTLEHVFQPWMKKRPKKTISFDIYCKNDYEVAGKLHQVLKEHFHGKLSGQLYPNHQIVWKGTMKIPISNNNNDTSSSATTTTYHPRLWFICQMIHQHGKHFKVNLIHLQGDEEVWMKAANQFISTLFQYEDDANQIMIHNGWMSDKLD